MATMKRIGGAVALIALMMVVFTAGWIVAKVGIGADVDPASLSEHERRFTEQMKNASLVGRFTIAGREDQTATPDRYDLAGVTKVDDRRWRFDVRMHRGGGDVMLPVTVPMQWVGDTPMIVLTNYAIPTLGTFSVRLLFYGDRYAGTWQTPKVGGHMYGRIEKLTN